MSNNTIKPRLIRLIHIAKQQVGMSDNDYRALLANVSRGKTSSKDLTAEQLETVLRHMKAQGFVATVKTPDGRERYRNLPNQQKKNPLAVAGITRSGRGADCGGKRDVCFLQKARRRRVG